MKITPAIKNFFTTNILTLHKNENTFAKKVKVAFDIKDSWCLWKIAAYIKYKTDNILDYKQTFQTLDFTMWRGEGDCEDTARALKKVAEQLELSTYYLMLFEDSTLQNGHTTLLLINENKHLAVCNYTEYYEVMDYELEPKDIALNTEKFQSAMEIFNGSFYPKTLPWSISWLIKTDINEYPQWYIQTTTNQTIGNVKYRYHPQDRELVLQGINNLNVSTNLTFSDYIIRGSAAALGGLALWYLTKK